MEYQATAKYIHTSTRKLRLVADSIRRLSPVAAVARLSQLSQHAAVPLESAISSALANAKSKEANLDALQFKTIEIMGGPAMKRWHAVSRGQAHAYKKRMTHIRIILSSAELRKKAVSGK